MGAELRTENSRTILTRSDIIDDLWAWKVELAI
jgi:hypothetical protein